MDLEVYGCLKETSTIKVVNCRTSHLDLEVCGGLTTKRVIEHKSS